MLLGPGPESITFFMLHLLEHGICYLNNDHSTDQYKHLTHFLAQNSRQYHI